MKEELQNTVMCIEHKRRAKECDHGAHYTIYGFSSIDDLKRIFPEGKANDLNWFVASTSGVHGTYSTLDEIEKSIHTPVSEQKEDEYYPTELTCLIIMPRLVCLTYGCIEITKQEEIDYLRTLISSSLQEIVKTQSGNILTT